MGKLSQISRKTIALVFSVAILVSSLSISSMGEVQAGKETDYGINNPRVEYNYRETVIFGNYWQEDTNGNGVADKKDSKQPITWQILKKYSDGTALVISDKILDYQIYKEWPNEDEGEVHTPDTWELSTIRAWLNGLNSGCFYSEAFNTYEKKAIKEEIIVNEDNPFTKIDGGNNTRDKVFLLSLNDLNNVSFGFEKDWNLQDQARIAQATGFAKESVDYVNSDNTGEWWLRSPGAGFSGSTVGFAGFVNYSGAKYVDTKRGVRPALRIDLASPNVKKGSKVPTSIKGVEWDTIMFGKYEGHDLKWRVLSVNGDDAFVLSNEIIALKIYSESNKDVTWKDSEIRKWLNGDFYNFSFDSDEKKSIKTTVIANDDNEKYGTRGGENTKDNIYLLSLSDIKNASYGFPNIYAVASETRVAKDITGGECQWTLRSPGEYSFDITLVDFDGYVSALGEQADFENGIRPALHINLSLNKWKKGNKITFGKLDYGHSQDGGENNTSSNTVKALDRVKITKVRNVKKRKISVSWKKITGAKGYKIQYSTNKKFKKAKTKTTKKTIFTIKKLKKKKTYYLRVRAFTIDSSGKKVLGKWSKVKKIKIKK